MGQEAADQDWRSTGRSRSTGESPSPHRSCPLLYGVTEPRPRRTQMCGGALAVREDGGRLLLHYEEHERIQVKVV